MAITQGAQLGPYEIVAQLGVGGMGEVYLAEDSRLRRKVALEVLPDDSGAERERPGTLKLSPLQNDEADKAREHPRSSNQEAVS